MQRSICNYLKTAGVTYEEVRGKMLFDVKVLFSMLRKGDLEKPYIWWCFLPLFPI